MQVSKQSARFRWVCLPLGLLLRLFVFILLASDFTSLSEISPISPVGPVIGFVTLHSQEPELYFLNTSYIQRARALIEKLAQSHKLEKEAVLSFYNVQIDQIPNLRLPIESIRRTAEYASDISEIVLDLNMESVLG